MRYGVQVQEAADGAGDGQEGGGEDDLVGVALDTVRSLESQMMMRHYKGFLE